MSDASVQDRPTTENDTITINATSAADTVRNTGDAASIADDDRTLNTMQSGSATQAQGTASQTNVVRHISLVEALRIGYNAWQGNVYPGNAD